MEFNLKSFELKLKSKIPDVLIEWPESYWSIEKRATNRWDSREADELKEESSAKKSPTSEPSEKPPGRLVEVPVTLECTCLQNDDKYILNATIKNTSEHGIDLPQYPGHYALGVGLRNDQGHVKPKEPCKSTRLIDNMVLMGDKLIHVCPGKEIVYQIDLSSIYRLRNGVFMLDCQLDIEDSRHHFISNKVTIPVLVQLPNDDKGEKIRLELDPDFLKITKFMVSN